MTQLEIDLGHLIKRYAALSVIATPRRPGPPRTVNAGRASTRAAMRLALAIVNAADHHKEHGMISTETAHQLRALIEQYRDAEIADSWKGAGDPADRPAIEQELAETKRDLEMFIHVLEHGNEPQPAKLAERV